MTQPLPISAYVICQDEAPVIEACLRSLAICAEIIVVDSGSTDATLERLTALKDQGLPIQVLEEPWRGFAGQKQFALDQCRQEWCLNLDADERLSPRLTHVLPDLLTAGPSAYAIKRYEYLPGYGYVGPRQRMHFSTRLVRRGTARYDLSDLVHEGLRTDAPPMRVTEGGLMHFKREPLDDLWRKDNTYSSLKARMRRQSGRPAKPGKMVLSPAATFWRNWLGHGLWRNGWAGYITARRAAMTSFMADAKRWEADALDRAPIVEPEPDDRY
jgi:glycosyltransferase involved in cell wall biosynthesis